MGRLARRQQGRWLGGVCGGVAARLGLTPAAVRAGVVVIALTGGPPVLVAYLVAWALLPTAEATEAAGRPAAGGAGGGAVRPPGTAAGGEVLAGVAVVVGAVLLVSELSGMLPRELLLPALLAGAGTAVVWGRRDANGATGSRTFGVRPLRLAVGLSLVLVAGFAMLAAVSDFQTIGRSAAGAAVVVAGLGLLLGPGLLSLVRSLSDERRARIRSQERAEVATHLHDGVLQTLALIQRRADDEREVRSLARRQERELRDWLYGTLGSEEPATVVALLRRELADVEDRYGVRLDAVLVGDAPLDDAARALVAAGREAALNAARHAGVDTVDVYLEVEPEQVSLFVRDRGRGFDPAAVPPDRRGLADSVRGRIHRHGGTVAVRSAPGDGAEVEMTLPRRTAAMERP